MFTVGTVSTAGTVCTVGDESVPTYEVIAKLTLIPTSPTYIQKLKF